MKFSLVNAVLKTVLPPLLGAAGAVAASLAPAYHAAVCGGFPVSIPGI